MSTKVALNELSSHANRLKNCELNVLSHDREIKLWSELTGWDRSCWLDWNVFVFLTVRDYFQPSWRLFASRLLSSRSFCSLVFFFCILSHAPSQGSVRRRSSIIEWLLHLIINDCVPFESANESPLTQLIPTGPLRFPVSQTSSPPTQRDTMS